MISSIHLRYSGCPSSHSGPTVQVGWIYCKFGLKKLFFWNIKKLGFSWKVWSPLSHIAACSPANNGLVAIKNIEGCWVRLAQLRKKRKENNSTDLRTWSRIGAFCYQNWSPIPKEKIVFKIVTKIILKCSYDFQTCANYQFFPILRQFYGSSELGRGSQNWLFALFLVCSR